MVRPPPSTPPPPAFTPPCEHGGDTVPEDAASVAPRDRHAHRLVLKVCNQLWQAQYRVADDALSKLLLSQILSTSFLFRWSIR